MIDLYSFPTPNGFKVSIALEELGLPWTFHPVDITRGEQFAADFLAISPNNRVPAIVDRDPASGGPPLSVFESGAILLYLAEKTGRLMPRDPRRRVAAIEWLMWQMAGLGPMCGQAGHFRGHAPVRVDYAIDRYTTEVQRLYRVLDERLSGREYLADEYSMADIACWPWIALHGHHGVDPARHPALQRWFDRVAAREAVQRGTAAGLDAIARGEQTLDDEAKRHLFGQR